MKEPFKVGAVSSLPIAWLFLMIFTPMAVRSLPAQTGPEAMAAHDAHQGVVIGADPYVDAERSKQKFGKKHPQAAGILALDTGFRNDTDKPISLNLERIRLNLEVPGQQRQTLEPLSMDDVADEVVNPHPAYPKVSRIPIPGRGPKIGRSKDWKKFREMLGTLSLDSDVLPPHTTVRGFLYFDVSNHFDWLEHSTLYVPGLRFIPSGEELMYFEVELAPALPH